MVVPVPEIGYNSDYEQYRSGYARLKSFHLKTLALITSYLALGGISGTVIIAVVLLLAVVFFIRIKE